MRYGPGRLGHRVAVLAVGELEVGPVVVDDLQREAEHLALGRKGELGVVVPVGAGVVVGGDVVEPVLQVAHRPSGGLREGARDRHDLHDQVLAAEAAADRARDEPQPVGGHAEDAREHPGQEVVEVGVRPDGHRAGVGVPRGQRARGLQRRRAHAVPAPAAPHDGGGAGEVPLHVAEVEAAVEHDVAVEGVVHAGGVGPHRGDRVDDRLEHLVVDLDQRAGVLGDVAVGGRDDGDGLAGVAHLLRGDRGLRHRLGAERGHRPDVLQRLGAGEDADHAGQRPRGARVDRADAGVGVRAAQHGGVQHAGHHDVADVARASGQQLRVFLAGGRLADVLVAHTSAPAATTDRTMFW